jgi:hypothetical protein
LNNGEATAYVDNVITHDFNRDPSTRRHDWTGWFFHIGHVLGNSAIANVDLYVWDLEELYPLLIRPEDGETWGPIPWMDEKWIAENSFEIDPETLAAMSA